MKKTNYSIKIYYDKADKLCKYLDKIPRDFVGQILFDNIKIDDDHWECNNDENTFYFSANCSSLDERLTYVKELYLVNFKLIDSKPLLIKEFQTKFPESFAKLSSYYLEICNADEIQDLIEIEEEKIKTYGKIKR